jgi:3-hydroxy-D-aspartate aldolase
MTSRDLTRLRVPSTPALVLFRDALERNLDRMQARCANAGVRLRAHGKMHKCSTLAKLQIAKGAVGVCAQTVGEAEAFVANGVTDVLVTSPPPLWSAPRLAALSRNAQLASVVDDPLLVAALSKAARSSGTTLDLLVDIDLGQHRTGVQPKEVLALAQVIAAGADVRFAGVQGYLGHLQHIAERSSRLAANARNLASLRETLGTLERAGLAARIVTGGGTGTHIGDLASRLFTEIQAGSYAVMDVEYAACDSPEGGPWPFESALLLAATVVSARHRTHVTIDAGLKALSVDGPAAKVVAGAARGSLWRPLGDEHGAILHPAALEALQTAGEDPLSLQAAISSADAQLQEPADAPRLGDTVWLQPGHCDPTINLHDAFYVAERDGSWSRWPIDARRKTPDV